MVLCGKKDVNPKLGNGLGPWPGGFVLIGGSEAVTNNFPTLINLQKALFGATKYPQNTNMRVLHNHAFQTHIVLTVLENPMGNPWPVRMPGVCGFSLGLGCCRNVRQSWQA